MSDSKTNQTFKISCDSNQIKKMMTTYDAYQIFNNSEYIIGRYKTNDTTITIYKTNNVLFQGQGAIYEYNKWAAMFGLEIVKTASDDRTIYSNLSAIGSDEVGTGDYFGPIVVCATYVSSDQIESLKQMGVKDSKLLSDQQIIEIALKIANLIKYSVILISPEKYNSLNNEKSNLNFIKSYLHNKTILSLETKLENNSYEKILIDEFTPKDKYFEYLKDVDQIEHEVIMITQGEKAHVAIAAASILARYTFLKEIKKMSENYKITIFKGAGTEVDKLAVSFVKTYGWDELKKVVKFKYANTERLKAFFTQNPLPESKKGSFDL